MICIYDVYILILSILQIISFNANRKMFDMNLLFYTLHFYRNRDNTNPAFTKINPPILFAAIFINARLSRLSPACFIVSNPYAENVVNAPKNPVIKNSLNSGLMPFCSPIPNINPITKHPIRFTISVPNEKCP